MFLDTHGVSLIKSHSPARCVLIQKQNHISILMLISSRDHERGQAGRQQECSNGSGLVVQFILTLRGFRKQTLRLIFDTTFIIMRRTSQVTNIYKLQREICTRLQFMNVKSETCFLRPLQTTSQIPKHIKFLHQHIQIITPSSTLITYQFQKTVKHKLHTNL